MESRSNFWQPVDTQIYDRFWHLRKFSFQNIADLALLTFERATLGRTTNFRPNDHYIVV